MATPSSNDAQPPHARDAAADGQDHPTVARSIAAHFARILELWSGEVRTHASARGLSRPECENLMPEYLRSFTEPERLPPQSSQDDRFELVEAHLVTRLRQGFDLAEIVDEFALIGRCVARIWTEQPAAERPDPVASERFYAELQVAAARVADVFQRHMLEDEQRQKRLARRLDEAGQRALRSEIDEQDYADVLDLIVEATGAVASTITIADLDTGLRRVACAVGPPPAAKALEVFAAALEERIPPGSHEPVTSLDVAAEPPLRAVGVRHVLVTRFPAGDGRRGAIVLAIAEDRPFTSREIGRVEAFADRLSLHEERLHAFAKLRCAVAELERERTFRERFVALLAHDLRTPIATAKGYADMLRTSQGTIAPKDIAARISKVLGRVDGMVHDMLDATRIHGGELPPLDLAEGDLRDVVRDALDDIDAAHPGRTVLEPGTSVEGRFGAKEIRRAVWNLVLNGIKYGAEGRPVRVAVRRRGESAQIAVHNEGRPIDPILRARLFEPFSRGDGEVSSAKGWGLGLTLVRGAALAHGGDVTVDSDETRGTTFTMTLPLAPPAARPERPPPVRARSSR